MKEKFPPMNGEYAPNDDALDDDENLELHMVDYSIGYNVIYAVFSWSVADEAYELMRSLAQKRKVGFFICNPCCKELMFAFYRTSNHNTWY